MKAKQNESIFPGAKTYVRVTLRIGQEGRKITIWAEKLGQYHYRKVDKFGDWGFDHTDRQYIGSAADVLREQPAKFSKKYGELEVI